MKSAIVRFVLLLIVAFAVVAAWLLVSGDADEPEATPLRARLYTASQDDIVNVTVQTEAGTVMFERRDDGWYFADSPVPVNLDRWGGVVLLLSGPEVERQLAAPVALSEFGLDEPDIVSVGLEGGSRVEVRLGAETPDGRNVYTQLEGKPEAALVNEPWARVLRRLAAEPPLPYWYYCVDSALVRLFEVESADGIVTFLLGLAGSDGGPPDRVVQGDAASDLTDAQRDAVLSVAGGPPGFDPAIWPEGLTPENAGLQPPRAVIRVTYELAVPLEDKRAVSAVYAVGERSAAGDGYYAATPDSPLLLTFDAAWVEEALSLVGREFAGGG
ncbi:MAG: hypothetical protein F4185_05325 [Chloroflexi bacterium]|nr:hypothetical protein [Chloroflexota bacterium]MYF65328.1 hypothetical protein [Chloroflexota bacterium]MYK34910.1 hypothetical protein [Chloroflexota bacterium]